MEAAAARLLLAEATEATTPRSTPFRLAITAPYRFITGYERVWKIAKNPWFCGIDVPTRDAQWPGSGVSKVDGDPGDNQAEQQKHPTKACVSG